MNLGFATVESGFCRAKNTVTILAKNFVVFAVSSIVFLVIEIVVADGVADRVVALITAAAKTGSIGDGKVFVELLEEAVRIRTGELGDNAV